jgi:hypothetical protein
MMARVIVESCYSKCRACGTDPALFVTPVLDVDMRSAHDGRWGVALLVQDVPGQVVRLVQGPQRAQVHYCGWIEPRSKYSKSQLPAHTVFCSSLHSAWEYICRTPYTQPPSTHSTLPVVVCTCRRNVHNLNTAPPAPDVAEAENRRRGRGSIGNPKPSTSKPSSPPAAAPVTATPGKSDQPLSTPAALLDGPTAAQKSGPTPATVHVDATPALYEGHSTVTVAKSSSSRRAKDHTPSAAPAKETLGKGEHDQFEAAAAQGRSDGGDKGHDAHPAATPAKGADTAKARELSKKGAKSAEAAVEPAPTEEKPQTVASMRMGSKHLHRVEGGVIMYCHRL